MSEKQFWTEQHYEIYNQIEELKKKKIELSNETVEIDYLGGRNISKLRYSEFELPRLFRPIDEQIQELTAKFHNIPLRYSDIVLIQEPIVYVSLHEEFKLTWSQGEHKWKAYTTLMGVQYHSIKVLTDEQNRPIKILFDMVNSETKGELYKFEATLIQEKDYEYPKVEIPKPQGPIKLPTLVKEKCKFCSNENAWLDNYTPQDKICKWCMRRQSEPLPEPEPQGKLKRIRDMFSRD
jgi:hypothetical protein